MGGPAAGECGRPQAAPTGGWPREDMEVELSIMELRDELEEEGLDEDVIDAKCDALRTTLLEKAAEATPGEADEAAVLGVVAAQPGRDAQDPPGETLAHTSCSLCLGQCLAGMCMMLCCGDCG